MKQQEKNKNFIPVQVQLSLLKVVKYSLKTQSPLAKRCRNVAMNGNLRLGPMFQMAKFKLIVLMTQEQFDIVKHARQCRRAVVSNVLLLSKNEL